MIKYFYSDGKNKVGPLSKEELKNKELDRHTKVWFYGLDDWMKIKDIPELNDVLISIPPDIPKAKNDIEEELTPKEIPALPETKTNYSINNKQGNNKNNNSFNWVLAAVVILVIGIVIWVLNTNNSTFDAEVYNEVVQHSYNSDEDFQFYTEKYFRDLEAFGIFPTRPKQTIIKFSNLDQLQKTSHVHALSFGINNDEIIEIYINRTSWSNFNKPLRYYLMYHELSHDVLNLDDLKAIPSNKGKMMYPEISNYEGITMDDFIESSHELFENYDSNN